MLKPKPRATVGHSLPGCGALGAGVRLSRRGARPQLLLCSWARRATSKTTHQGTLSVFFSRT
jgi:hypothetical protein